MKVLSEWCNKLDENELHGSRLIYLWVWVISVSAQ